MVRPRKILKQAIQYYKKRGHLLSETDKKYCEDLLEQLDQAILHKEKDKAKELAKEVSDYVKPRYKKTAFDHVLEIVYALIFAIVIAFLVRTFWFELYEVPTGSMRPTVEELDRLVVSKTTFGIRIPFKKGLLFFSPERLLRNGTIVFSAKDMDVADQKMVYFYLFPGYKQFIKRCMGKPGDTLYFYGGLIYGIDKDGKPITSMFNEEELAKLGLSKIEHIPFITFDGKFELTNALPNGLYRNATILQMNEPVAKLELERGGKINGLFYNGKTWVKDNPAALKSPHNTPESYSDLWGIGNYAMCRLLTLGQLKAYIGEPPKGSSDAVLFLELRHTPNMTYPKPEVRRDEQGRIHPVPTPYTTILPLTQKDLDKLQNALSTARFTVKNGKAYRYQKGGGRPQPVQFDPRFSGVPDGTYEFYYGKGFKVHMGGILTELPTDNPLYDKDPENIQKLFNLGFTLNILFSPHAPNQPFNPQRFAYYRNGALYVMGAPLFEREDPTLAAFVKQELAKQEKSSEEAPYIAFVDHGPPLTEDGQVDATFIQAFGLHIPEDGILALGDNYAMSADSRDFGFVPPDNMRGSPSFTFWPPGPRFGPLPQPSYPWGTLPNMIVWGIVIIIVIVLVILWSQRRQTPRFKRD